MISADAIIKKLNIYASTEQGKRVIKNVFVSARISGKKLANGSDAFDKESMKNAAFQFIEILRRHIPDSIKSTGDTLKQSVVTVSKDGSATIAINFDRGSLHRKSLYEDGYPDGIENIVALLNGGYHAKNYVYGWWDGHSPNATKNLDSAYRSGNVSDSVFVRSKKDRDAMNFMQEAVEEFQLKYGSKANVSAVLSAEYTE